jgi:hypothetical protein
MRYVKRALLIVLVPIIVSMGLLPQMAEAHASDMRMSPTPPVEKPQLPPLFSSLWAYAETCSSLAESTDGTNVVPQTAGNFTDPENNATGNVTASRETLAQRAAMLAATDWSTPRNPDIDVDALIAAATPLPAAGLVLTTARNTWDSPPQSHDEMVRCVEDESLSDPDWFGASVVDELNQAGNIHGNSDNNSDDYVSRYEAFFLVESSGNWTFAIDSAGASEIEIDGQVVAEWYGDHTRAGDWSHIGSVVLDVGWHFFVYRQEAIDEATPVAAASFKRPGDADWTLVGTSGLTLRPVNLDDGVLLTTKKNTWSSLPETHADLLDCVEAAVPEAGWYGSSIVKEINQEGNIHGSESDLVSLYEGFFLAETAGTWEFTGPDGGASDIEIDEQVVAGRYGTDNATATGNVSLDGGCFRGI